MKLSFYIKYSTAFGETLFISGNVPELGELDSKRLVAMEYVNDSFWRAEVEIARTDFNKTPLKYKYYLQSKNGELIADAALDRAVDFAARGYEGLTFSDVWNHAGDYENVFFTAPFANVLLPKVAKVKPVKTTGATHIFKVKAPLLHKHEVICLTGAGTALNNWDTEAPVLLSHDGIWWTTRLNLSEEHFPLTYKYGIYNTKEKTFVSYETGDNRIIHGNTGAGHLSVLHDGFVQIKNNNWKGAGVAIPVFSLRSKNSFGVGEFADIKLLVDWAVKSGLKLIQLLPVNDTTATHSWMDSYPYAAISAFALHPQYINLAKVAGKKHQKLIASVKKKQKQLNELATVDYEEVMKFKLALLKELFEEDGKECLASDDYKLFYEQNQHWLKPYAAFSYLRDKNGTSDFNEWKTYSSYNPAQVSRLFTSSAGSRQVQFFCYVQYHLHLQLKEATDYAHKKGIVVKGDIPIGVYRFGCDAWVAPELYNMDQQAGAPPDDFAAVGQNWGFPTYNWKTMQADNFAWWRQRFQQMSNYFDLFRIDHILGFFRIWSIPVNAVQGIMGRFVPCIPVHYVEFGENGIWFDYDRYCKPFINDHILYDTFNGYADTVRTNFLQANDRGGYDLLPEYDTQQKVEQHFAALEQTADNEKMKLGLFDLIANVILFEQENSQGQEFHFRIAMEKTASFKNLIPHVQDKLRELYINYFYRRQDGFWQKEAMQKLPPLKEVTNMLICGEDLGMVPDSVPQVMQQLGILSLEIQRMPKDAAKEFFLPADAPYLSVITPSTHDMSTVRGWWEEDQQKTQSFFNQVLEQHGHAPYFCEPWISRAIVLQHLYSPAMWSIFQLQDILGMSETLRRDNPADERINVPANSKHYWRYRMHMNLEDLLKEDDFNEELKGYVMHSGR